MKEFTPVINDAFCKGCSICVAVCPKKRLHLTDKPAASGYLSVYLHKNQYRIPPCNHACPTGEKIQAYVDLINQSTSKTSLRAAWELLTADNPFPAVCGRVCFHPCEYLCNRGEYDEPISIHLIERFIGDAGIKESFNWKLPKLNNKSRVAIIGGGPAGLSCAYHLRRAGYASTIFEAENQLGGLLTQGIPGYRLPHQIARLEISRIIRTGIKVNLNSRIGRDDYSRIEKEFDAVFVAVGAHKERKLGIPNEEHQSVLPALELLKDICRKKPVKLGRRTGIIGGGNAAIDAARSVRRLGGKPIVIYRRTENEMPAIREEISEAKKEEIEFVLLAAPRRILIKNNKVFGLKCIRMKLGAPDRSGRRTPVPVQGSDFTVPVDALITAIGEEPDSNSLPESIGGAKNGIFAGGDAVTGPASVVEALGAGKKTAGLIDSYLRKSNQKLNHQLKPIKFKDMNIWHFKHADSVRPREVRMSVRHDTFNEVCQGYRPQDLAAEATRCFNCGSCRTCLECELHCPDMAIEVTNK